MELTEKSLRILVTDADKLAGLGAIRSLGSAGHTVTSSFPECVSPPACLWSRHCRETVTSPDSWREFYQYRDWLDGQIHSGKFDVIFPIAEAAILAASFLRKNCPKDVQLILPSDLALKCTLSKYYSTKKALECGVPCPKTIFVSDGDLEGNWRIDFSELQFPLILKTDNCLRREGIYEKGQTFVIRDEQEGRKVLDMLKGSPARIIAQEMIEGAGEGVFLLRWKGISQLKFSHRRLHEVPYTGGYSSYRESTRDSQLIDLSEALLDSIGLEGLAMVEYKRSKKDGSPYFLEINGRPWGSIALALHCGVDFPRQCIEAFRGHGFSVQKEYSEGVKCRNIFPGEIGHLLSILKAGPFWSRNVESPSKIKALFIFFALSCDPRIRHDYFWWTDPLPGLFQIIRTLWDFGKLAVQKGKSKIYELRYRKLLNDFTLTYDTKREKSQYFSRPVKTILFLCYGNICRSPFSAIYWNNKITEGNLSGPVAFSAGFHKRAGRSSPMYIANVAKNYGVDLTCHGSGLVTRKDILSADVVFVMDRLNYQQLLSFVPKAKEKTYLLGHFAENGKIEIEDPWNKGVEDARRCYDHIILSIDNLMRVI